MAMFAQTASSSTTTQGVVEEEEGDLGPQKIAKLVVRF